MSSWRPVMVVRSSTGIAMVNSRCCRLYIGSLNNTYCKSSALPQIRMLNQQQFDQIYKFKPAFVQSIYLLHVTIRLSLTENILLSVSQNCLELIARLKQQPIIESLQTFTWVIEKMERSNELEFKTTWTLNRMCRLHGAGRW